MTAQVHRDRHGKGYGPRVAAGEEQDDEFGRGISNDCNILASFKAEAEQALRRIPRGLPQFFIAQNRFQATPGIVKIEASAALGCIFQCLSECLKVSESLGLVI